MPLSTAGKNIALDAWAAAAAFASLHDADPGTNGANELTGGDPAYARKAMAWGGAANGSVSQSAAKPVFDVPAGSTVAYVGYWASDGTTFLGADQVTAEVYAAQGTYTLNTSAVSLTDPA